MATKRGGSSEQVCGGSERKRISRHRLLVIKENGKCQFLEMTCELQPKVKKRISEDEETQSQVLSFQSVINTVTKSLLTLMTNKRNK